MSSLCLIKHHSVKAYGGMKIQLHAFFSRHEVEVSGQLHAETYFSSRGKDSRHPLDRSLGEPQSQSGSCGEEKHHVSSLKIGPRFLGRQARRLVTISSKLKIFFLWFVLAEYWL
jgi:hypothetical protein